MPDQPLQPHHPRTIDERLDSLASSMELQAGMLRDLEANIEKLTINVDKLTSKQSETDSRASATDARIERLTSAVEIDAENIRALARIAEAHQQRIEILEGQNKA